MKHNGNIEILGFLINPKLNSVESDAIPVFSTEDKGLIFFNDELKTLTINNGDGYVSLVTDDSTNSSFIDTLGNNWINASFSFNPTPFNDLDNISGLTANDSLFTVIAALDTALSNVSVSIADINDIGNVDTADAVANSILLFNSDLGLVAGTIGDLEITFDSLSDSNLDTLTDNDYITYRASDNKFINSKKTFVYENLIGAESFIVNHRLGSKYCHVTVIDRDAERDITTSGDITYISNNQLRVDTEQPHRVTILVQAP